MKINKSRWRKLCSAASAPELVQQDLDNADYDYRTKDWFKLPIASLESTWSEPYFDEGGGDVLMTTFSVPFFYEGELKDGKRHGKGIHRYANGDVYDGEWKDNSWHGREILTEGQYSARSGGCCNSICRW